MNSFDVIVLGGGAAGLMCAIAAGQRGRKVLVLEGSNRIGKKILMSGGGRCNFTNLYCEPENYLSANPHFCKSALSRYTQWDFIALVDKHGIAWHEKTLGQLFCDDSSKQIVAMLASECDDAGVRILTDAGVETVVLNERYEVHGAVGSFTAESLVIATGGLSIPRMGATDFGYRLARQFGLNVLDTRAGLVPFTFTGDMHERMQRMSGISTAANLTANTKTFAENILFTHRGLSGPAALQVSSYWQPGDEVRCALLPDQDIAGLLLAAKSAQPRSLLRSILTEYLPKALITELQSLFWHEQADTPLSQIPDRRLHEIAANMADWRLRPAATEGYRTAEVTLGGVDTAELSSQTMEVQRSKGLYCIGEVVDVTGHLGGFNFQWAWASGQAAGQVA